jgi:hypothetical protein
MYTINTYKDLCTEIEMHEHLLDISEKNYKYYNDILNNRNPNEISAICNEDMPNGARIDMDLVQAIDRAHRWSSAIDIENDNLKFLQEKKSKIDECMNNLDITIKVSTLRSLGMTQEEVAEIVNRSPRQVQNIEYKIRNNN